MIGLFLAFGLALLHSSSSSLPLYKVIPKYRWTSFAGGVSLSFVFLEVFPELAHLQGELLHSQSSSLAIIENHVYLSALIGLVIFYVLDVLAQPNHPAISNQSKTARAFAFVPLLKIWAFAIINVITGYLIQELSHSNSFACILFVLALALHFFIIDEHLLERFQDRYDVFWRWILVAAIISGAILGQTIKLNPVGLIFVWSFLAGSIILNVLKRELPEVNQTCLASFLTGVVLFSGLVLLQ